MANSLTRRKVVPALFHVGALTLALGCHSGANDLAIPSDTPRKIAEARPSEGPSGFLGDGALVRPSSFRSGSSDVAALVALDGPVVLRLHANVASTARVKVRRQGYDGPIEVTVSGLPLSLIHI